LAESDRVKELWEEAVQAILSEDFRKWDARWGVIRAAAGSEEARRFLHKLVGSDKNEHKLQKLPTDVRHKLRTPCAEVMLMPSRPLLVPIGLGEIEPLLRSSPDWAGYTAFVLLADDKLNWLPHVPAADRAKMRKRAREFLLSAPTPAVAAYVHAVRP